MAITTKQGLKEVLNDPVAFSEGILKHKLWQGQKDILRAIQEHRRVAVKACHSSGKTFIAANALLWWILKYPDGIAISTAPTWSQVSKVMWDYVHKAIANSKISFGEVNQTEFKLGPGNFAIGLSTDQGIRFQGYKGRILLILDEAPGIKSDIWEAIEGMAAGGDVHMLALGNPTIASGNFYDAFNKNRASWHAKTISAFDTPNLEGAPLNKLLDMKGEELDLEVFPGLVSRRWVKEKYREFGPGHYFWDSRVLGEFPQNQADALIKTDWIKQAYASIETTEPLVAGVDVAGQGRDRTVLVMRRGGNIVGIHAWRKDDPRGEVIAAIREYGLVKSVNVDSVGIGYNFALHLKDQGLPVRLVNVGMAARNTERFKNLKAELSWGLRQRFMDGAVHGLIHEQAINELQRLRYGHNERGLIVMESKEEVRKSDGYSPDFADALMLCFAYSPIGLEIQEQTEQSRPKPITAGLLNRKL